MTRRSTGAVSYGVWSTVPFFAERRDDDRRDPGAGADLVAGRRCDVVPGAAVLVVGDDDDHVVPLRAGLQLRDEVGDLRVAVGQAGVARVLVEDAFGLVERDRRQRAHRRSVGDEVSVILEVRTAVGSVRRRVEVGVVVERMVVRLEVDVGEGVEIPLALAA